MKASRTKGSLVAPTRFVAILLILGMCVSILPIPAHARVYRSVDTKSKRIALTFDDGPHPYLTERILKILERYGIKATFFMIGTNVREYPSVAAEVIAQGHEVGNHTYSHLHMNKTDLDHLGREIAMCEDTLKELCEYTPHLFRPPEGVVKDYVETCAEKGNYKMILWSLDTRDWEVKNAEKIAQTVLDGIRPGDIILMHDFIGHGSKTPEALEALLPRLLALGYEPVTVSELLERG